MLLAYKKKKSPDHIFPVKIFQQIYDKTGNQDVCTVAHMVHSLQYDMWIEMTNI